MFTFFEQLQRAGGLSRRQILSAGAIGGGLTLVRLLQAEQAAGIRSSRKAVINIHLDGGPPQMDMIDLKPNSPPRLISSSSSARSSARRTCTTHFSAKAASTPKIWPASAVAPQWARSS